MSQDATTDTSVNGWKNYATASIVPVIDTHAIDDVIDMARRCIAGRAEYEEVQSGTWTPELAEKCHFADDLKDYVEELIDGAGDDTPDPAGKFISAFVLTAFEQVDWEALADHYLERARDTPAPTD